MRIGKECPRCGSTLVMPIIYGYQTLELEKKVRRGEVAYGGRVPSDRMPSHKCRRCHTAFAVGHRTRQALSLTKIVFSFVLLMFAAYFAGNATILSDSVANSVILQLLAPSIAASIPVADFAIWVLGLFAVIPLLTICVVKKSKTMVWSVLGYVTGFLFSAWNLKAWWTIVIETISLILFATVYAMLSG